VDGGAAAAPTTGAQEARETTFLAGLDASLAGTSPVARA
jgi:hypothetical protein